MIVEYIRAISSMFDNYKNIMCIMEQIKMSDFVKYHKLIRHPKLTMENFFFCKYFNNLWLRSKVFASSVLNIVRVK